MATKPTGRPRGNPNFIKGHPGGPGRPPKKNTGRPRCQTAGIKNALDLSATVPRCKTFMEQYGWQELERLALQRTMPKVQVTAIQLLAAYGYGKPTERVDMTSKGQQVSTLAAWLKDEGTDEPGRVQGTDPS